MTHELPLPLQRGHILRIHDGAGTRVAATSGMLWISEEGSLKDHVLMPGEVMTLRRPGKAVAVAVRNSRVVLRVTRGVAPRRVELAASEGERGRRVSLAAIEVKPLARFASRLTAWVLRSLDAVVTLMLHPER